MKLNLKTNTNIVYGRGILEKYGNEMIKLGKKPLIVSGKKSSKNSHGFKDITEFLKKNNQDFSVYIKEKDICNIEDIKKGIKFSKENNCDYVIAIGGGTTIDIGKGIAKGLSIGITEDEGSGCKLCTVPTLAGSGSETSKYALVYSTTRKGKNYKIIELEPNMTIVDPYYINRVNINEMKNASINGLSNLIEGYLNTNINKENEKIAIEGLRRLGESIDNLLDGNVNSRDRENLSMASLLGGILLNRYGRSIFNTLAESFSYVENIELGTAKGLLYNEYLKKFKKERKLNNIINVLGFSTFRDLVKTINKLSYNRNIKLETIDIDNLVKCSMKRISEGDKKVKNEVYYDIFNIYSNSLKNRELNYDII